ncbi:hypothetical protein RclHR1_11970002 [Rhizophagus clarus]|uniref:BTB/POZ domain-containing protein n=1 Tax=Rhizophagus clarus TaxID=94130 RepID=A0A2Z6QYP7_9GLOM|nr:hypothetical protein RclHR1_11970002 [Rhizophagus clarus]GES85016.1 BTB/POZ domain-containing protein [Rhizophagus clarus]
MSFEYSQEVIRDYEKLFETDEGYDVIIYAGENENVKEIHAFSNILRIRSQYFRKTLSNELTKKKDGKFIFNFPNISPQYFKIILRFIYCGKLDLSKLQGPEILKLLMAVDELKIQTLILCIQEYLIKHQHEFLQKNPTEILETVYQHEAFTDLWNYCLEEICTKPDILFNSNKFVNLKAPLLELLLKRDDLLLDEIIIWNSLIKWCLSQHPTIQQDVKKWNKEEIVVMERTIHRFIPLIRFYHISSADFITKVYLFKKIIPKDLVNNILVFHMAPDEQLNINIQPSRKPKCVFDSIIINNKHFANFSSWIEKKNQFHHNENNIPYNFNLLYRASRDGNTTAAFHAKCDNKGATIIVVKITNSEQIVGGYNPLFWDSSGTFKSTSDSFLFSFTNKNNLQSAKVSYSNGNQYSIYCHPDYVHFGGGGNLFFQDGMWNSYKSGCSSYPKIDDIPASFKADDYEVFQVVKK